MSRLKRPHIPLAVRVQVAARQAGFVNLDLFLRLHKGCLKIVLDRLLYGDDLGPGAGFQRGQAINLDHDPALVNRPFNKRTGKYTPDANDPAALVYRTKTDHNIKTRIRGAGAQHSDLGLARKNKRIARNRDPKRRRAKLRSRGFQKGPKRRWPRRKVGQ